MKRTILLSLAGLTLVAACTETLTRPTEVADAVNGRLAPRGPLFDDIANNLDPTVDAAAEAMPLNVGGANGTTQLYVTPQNGDGKNGCNLTGSTTLTVSVSSSNTAVATVSPSLVTFDSCGATATLTVTPVATGSATITVAQTGNTTGATFNLTPATFTVNVVAPAPANTAPSIVVAGVAGGASYSKGSVPAATCQVTDAEDGSSSFAATLSAVTGPYAADGIGSRTASCSYTDAGGLTASASETYSIVDPSAPVISYVLTPTDPDGSAGWYKSSVALTWTITESESPSSLSKTDCVDQNITADQAETTYSCTATSAGGTTGPQSVSIKRDATPPSASASASPAPNGNGWNQSAVTVSFTGTDATSLVASCDADVVLNEGADQSASGTCTDNAGNVSAPATKSGINVDVTNPTVSLVGGPTNSASYYFGSVPTAPTCEANDNLSGIDGGCSVTGYGTTVGNHTVIASTKDRAGNTATSSVSYTVLAWTLNGFFQPVDMGGVLNTVKAGSTVPLKFEIFAGSTELTATTSVKSFTASPASCNTSAGADDVEVTSTGGTTLRYDVTAGQFIQNWQTPKTVGLCYRAVMTAQDGSTLTALFRLK